MHGLFQDFKLVVEFGEQGALAKGAWDETSLQLLCDVVTGCDLFLRLGRLGQQLRKKISFEHRHN